MTIIYDDIMVGMKNIENQNCKIPSKKC